MKTLRTIVTLLLLALLVGCGPAKVWYQKGKSLQETQKQLEMCRGFALTDDPNKKNKNYVSDCMIGFGYALVDKKSLPAGATGVPNED